MRTPHSRSTLAGLAVAGAMCAFGAVHVGGQAAAPASPHAISPVFKAEPPRFSDPARRQKLGGAFADIDRLMQAFTTREHIPGATWGIVIDGELAHLGVAGSRDVTTKSAGDRGHRVPHRLDDQELHGDGDPEAARRREALAGRSGRAVRARADGSHVSDQRLPADHDPASAVARRGVPRGQPVGRPAARGLRRASSPR